VEGLALQSNKKHQYGVTCLREVGEHSVLTGSYDGFLKLWDSRKINVEVEERNTHR